MSFWVRVGTGSITAVGNGMAADGTTPFTGTIVSDLSTAAETIKKHSSDAHPLIIKANVVDGSSAVACALDNANALANAGAKILSLRVAGVEKHFFKPAASSLNGTLAVSGLSTLDSVSCTNNAAVGGTLAVTGASTLTGAVTASSTLAVTGASTLTGSVTLGAAARLISSYGATGTAGDDTQNKRTGLAKVASGASTVVITNSLVTGTGQLVNAWVQASTADATALYVKCVKVDGSAHTITITMNAIATADLTIGWQLLN